MKKRSPAAPKYNLSEFERFCISVYEGVGDAKNLQYADLSKHGGIAVRDADSYASTGRQYGWVTSEYGKGYSVNGPICKALRHPHAGEKEKIYLAAFTTPTIYRQIINDFNHKNITTDGLSLALIRSYDFAEQGAKEAAKVFIENATMLGLIDSEGHLNVEADVTITAPPPSTKQPKTSAAKNSTKGKTDEPKTKKNNAYVAPPIDHSPPDDKVKTISVYVRGRELNIPLLEDMKRADMEAMIKQLQNILLFMK